MTELEDAPEETDAPAMAIDIETIVDCGRSTALFSRYFMPESVPLPFSKGHYDLMAALDDPNVHYILIECHRGFGKTTIVKTWLAKLICYKLAKYILFISCTGKKAQKDAGNLRDIFDTNQMILGVWGKLEGRAWAQELWSTKPEGNWPGTVVEPVGNGQQVRGAIYGDARPDIIVIDDLEERLAMKGENYNENTKEYLFSDVFPLFNKSNPHNKMVILFTPEDGGSVPLGLVDDPAFFTIKVPLADDNLRSHWPEYMTDEAVREELELCRRNNMASTFYRERMLIVSNPEDQKFKEEMFRKYDEASEAFKKIEDELINVVIVDPAKTSTGNSAKTCIFVYGFHRQTGRFYIRHVTNEHMRISTVIMRTHEIAKRFKAKAVGVETTGVNDWFIQPFQDFMYQQAAWYHFEELKAIKSKDDRQLDVLPYYERGCIFHNPIACESLERQLLAYPHGKLRDVRDCAAYIPEMQNRGSLRFMNIPSKSYGAGVHYGEPSRFSPAEQRARASVKSAVWRSI